MYTHLLSRYQATLESRGIVLDTSQHAALTILTQLADTLASPPARIFRNLTFKRAPQGVYLYGGVGRGKTLLMDLFYQHVPIAHKRRMHFHDFMHTIHQTLHAHSGEKNPLKHIAQQWRASCELLCLDECTVDDVADALILGELLKHFFKSGIVLVTTSNSPPHKLYEKGVQRHLFLKAIAAIEHHCQVVQVDHGEDYRHRALPDDAICLPGQAHPDFENLFHQLATGPVQRQHTLIVDERPIIARAIAHRMVWFEFHEICMTFRSTADYLTLVKQFDIFFISDIPILFEKDINAARRFVHLIDVLYDHHAQLVLSSDLDIMQLYQGDMLKHEFMRTQSRLTEMMRRGSGHHALSSRA